MPDVFKLQLSYLDPDTAQVRVEQSPRGEPRHRMVPPFDPPTVRGLLQVLEKGDLRRCQLDDEELAALCALGVIQNGRLLGAEARNRLIGQRLFEALFPASDHPDHDVWGALEVALAQAQQVGESVPLQLRFDRDAVDLARLPWELICTQDDHLVAGERLRFTRYITFGQATAPFPVADRLEVLVVTSRPVDAAPINPTAERQAIQAAFEGLQTSHRLGVHLLTPPTLDALVAAVNARPYHVVHFDGHGAFARRCPYCEHFQPADLPFCTTPGCGARLDEAAMQGCLAFERKESNRVSHLVSAQKLATVLSGRQVRLFVASACQSATVGGLSVFSSVGPRLILAGVPAVVAMQFSVPVDSAVAFAGEFYAALARGESIAAAAAAGRRILYNRGTWYIPAIYLRNRDGEGFLFRFRDGDRVRRGVMDCDARATCIYLRLAGAPPLDWAALRPPEAAPYKFLSPYEATDAAVFHGRGEETQGLVAELLHRPFVVLHGPPGVGKSSLINAGLIPALLQHGYLVLTVREYGSTEPAEVGDPVEMLRQAVAASQALDVDLTDVEDLPGLVGALLRDIGRPLVVVFDEFEEFLRTGDAAQSEAFITQFAACVKAGYPLPACLLLVLREDSLGCLSAFEPHVPEIFRSLFPLGPMSREQAEQAIVQPLAQHEPPMIYDPAFLQDRLLPDLCAEEEGGAINPTHLQIVCHELYQAALRAGVRLLGRDLYPEGGTAAILSRYLEQALRQRFPEPERRELARALLKQMVSAAGERVFVATAEAAQAAGVELDQAQVVLDVLLEEEWLLDLRSTPDGVDTCSLSHDVLAAEVQRWFDRKEALVRCAQETLDRAWDDWYAQWYVARRGAEEGAADVRKLLVGPDRLREIRQWREQVSIEGPQFCLLLHSAVHHRTDMDYWAHQLQQDDEARQLLAQIHRRPDDAAHEEEVDLGAQALGLEPGDAGEQALARAAVARRDGTVRHAAALGLAALGLDAVQEGMATLAEAALPRRRWRRAQALAQMKAAGFPLPQLPLSLLAQVSAWRDGIRLFEARWRLVAQTLGAGLGGGLGLMLLMALVLLAVGYRSLGEIASYLLVGGVMGALFAAGRWLLDVLLARQAGRVLGGAVGFCLSLIALWPFTPSLTGWQLLGGLLAGAAVASGWELLSPPQKRGALWRAALGGGLGGALGFATTALSPLRLPFVLRPDSAIFHRFADQPWLPVAVVVLAALAGAAMGAGLAGGGAAGLVLWNRLSEASGNGG